MFLKVFPSVEQQTFYVISPRRIYVTGVVQMQKVFYSDHYFVQVLYSFNEVRSEPDMTPTVHFDIKTNLKFVKNVAMI